MGIFFKPQTFQKVRECSIMVYIYEEAEGINETPLRLTSECEVNLLVTPHWMTLKPN